jgi:hypothetical protein
MPAFSPKACLIVASNGAKVRGFIFASLKNRPKNISLERACFCDKPR